MELTMGQLMFYGGIGGAVFCMALFVLLRPLFLRGRKKKIDKIMVSKQVERR